MTIGTITPVSGPTANGSAPEGNIFDWALPAGMVIGDPVDFTIQITKVDTALCVPDSILLTQTSRVFKLHVHPILLSCATSLKLRVMIGTPFS